MIMIETIIYQNVLHGDWCKCTNCESSMLVPSGWDYCPECGSKGCLIWIDDDEESHERDVYQLQEDENVKFKVSPHNLSLGTKHCPRCGALMVPSENARYAWQCLECDEDFF